MIFAITEKGFQFWEMGKLWENHETSATIMHQLVERERESLAAFDLGDLYISIICIIIYIYMYIQ